MSRDPRRLDIHHPPDSLDILEGCDEGDAGDPALECPDILEKIQQALTEADEILTKGSQPLRPHGTLDS